MSSWTNGGDSEWLTRKRRIDPRLDALGWSCLKTGSMSSNGCHRTEEEETDNGPADYALWVVGVMPPHFQIIDATADV